MSAPEVAAGGLARRAGGVSAAALAAVLVLAALSAHGAAPFLFKRATLQSEIATQLRATTGLAVSMQHARFVLLPRPRVVAEAVKVFDATGTVMLDAAALDGEVRLLPLAVGRVELSAVVLREPHVAIDLAGQPVPADSTIGRAIRGRAAGGSGQRLGSVTLVDGTVRIADGTRFPPRLFTGINAAIEWSDLDQPATFNGSLQAGGRWPGGEGAESGRIDLAAWIARPSDLLRGDTSAVVLSAHTAALDASANGTVVLGPASTFRGHFTGKAASLAAALAAAAPGTLLPAPFADAALDGDARMTMDHARVVTLDLQNLAFRADGNDYEGTLAYRDSGKPMVSATLAVGRLALAPFTARLPALLDAGRRWSREALLPPRVGGVDVDLRVSASQLLLTPLLVDDAALAVISRNERLEVALAEGRLYGGALKARLSVGLGDGAVDLRGAGSISEADAAAMSWDLFGRQVATGLVSGSASVESAGTSYAGLMAHLKGWAKGSIGGGELSGIDLASAFRGADAGRPARDGPAPAVLAGGRTAFSTFDAAARLADGVATVGEARMSGNDAALTGGGTVDIAARRLDLHALASPPEGSAARQMQVPLAVSGPLDRIAVTAPADTPAAAPQP